MTLDKQAFLLYALVGVACVGVAWLVAGRPLPSLVDGRDAGTPARTVPAVARTASVELTGEHLLEANLLSAFVATGSRSKKCLLTLAESNAASPGATVFCGHRRYRGAYGVILRIYFAAAPPPSLEMTVTLHHEGAKRYGRPILYEG